MTLDPFLIRLLIAVLIYFLFDLVIKTFVLNAEARRIFEMVLLIAVLLFVILGSFLPLR